VRESKNTERGALIELDVVEKAGLARLEEFWRSNEIPEHLKAGPKPSKN
jgi:hypothetical protein